MNGYSEYMNLLSQQVNSPNFWCSIEYFEKAHASVHYDGDWVGIMCDGQFLLPPLHPKLFMTEHNAKFPIWADLSNYFSNTLHKVFLDYNFIYNPKYFLNLSGGRWKVFRKNIRKWPAANTEWVYSELSENSDKDINALMLSWLEGREEEIHDDEVMFNYLFSGKNRRGLYNKGRLVALNIWDENYKYINYRYCFCEQTPFLSEFTRYLFYIDPEILGKNKLVNDGGSLSVPELFAFKNRLNPVEIIPRHSWRSYDEV